MNGDVRETIRKVEEIIASQASRDLKKLLGQDETSDARLHELRGRVLSAELIQRTIRNSFGYDPETL